MKRTLELFSFIFIIPALLVGCDMATSSQTASTEAEAELFVRSFQDCDPDSEGCTYVRVTYPHFTGTWATELNALINKRLLDSESSTANREVLSLDQMAEVFLTDYERFATEFAGSEASWYLDREIEVTHEHLRVLGLQDAMQEYSGGAHALTAVYPINVDMKTGRVVELSDVFTPSGIQALPQLLEDAFRQQRSIPANASLTEQGNLFEEVLTPTESFSLHPDKIVFTYNPYDIAPYSEGIIEVSIPWKQIEPLLTPRYSSPAV